jgi:hypothetical protein
MKIEKERKKERERKKKKGGGRNKADPTDVLHAAVNKITPATYIN